MSDFYAIGRITRSIGLKGTFAVQPLTENPKRFLALKKVWIGTEKSQRKLFLVEKVAVQQRTIRLRLGEVTSREEADALVEKLVYVTGEEVVQVPKGTYFIHDIVGSSVLNDRGEKIGRVAEVWKLPANDVYVIRNGKREYLVPALRSIIKNVDWKKKEIVVQMIEGLLE